MGRAAALSSFHVRNPRPTRGSSAVDDAKQPSLCPPLPLVPPPTASPSHPPHRKLSSLRENKRSIPSFHLAFFFFFFFFFWSEDGWRYKTQWQKTKIFEEACFFLSVLSVRVGQTPVTCPIDRKLKGFGEPTQPGLRGSVVGVKTFFHPRVFFLFGLNPQLCQGA